MIIMWKVILLLIFGLGFLAIGIRHNKKIHSEEGFGESSSGSIIFDSILGILTGLVDKLPYWLAKSLYLTIAILCFIWAYIKFDAID